MPLFKPKGFRARRNTLELTGDQRLATDEQIRERLPELFETESYLDQIHSELAKFTSFMSSNPLRSALKTEDPEKLDIYITSLTERIRTKLSETPFQFDVQHDSEAEEDEVVTQEYGITVGVGNIEAILSSIKQPVQDLEAFHQLLILIRDLQSKINTLKGKIPNFEEHIRDHEVEISTLKAEIKDLIEQEKTGELTRSERAQKEQLEGEIQRYKKASGETLRRLRGRKSSIAKHQSNINQIMAEFAEFLNQYDPENPQPFPYDLDLKTYQDDSVRVDPVYIGPQLRKILQVKRRQKITTYNPSVERSRLIRRWAPRAAVILALAGGGGIALVKTAEMAYDSVQKQSDYRGGKRSLEGYYPRRSDYRGGKGNPEGSYGMIAPSSGKKSATELNPEVQALKEDILNNPFVSKYASEHQKKILKGLQSLNTIETFLPHIIRGMETRTQMSKDKEEYLGNSIEQIAWSRDEKTEGAVMRLAPEFVKRVKTFFGEEIQLGLYSALNNVKVDFDENHEARIKKEDLCSGFQSSVRINLRLKFGKIQVFVGGMEIELEKNKAFFAKNCSEVSVKFGTAVSPDGQDTQEFDSSEIQDFLKQPFVKKYANKRQTRKLSRARTVRELSKVINSIMGGQKVLDDFRDLIHSQDAFVAEHKHVTYEVDSKGRPKGENLVIVSAGDALIEKLKSLYGENITLSLNRVPQNTKLPIKLNKRVSFKTAELCQGKESVQIEMALRLSEDEVLLFSAELFISDLADKPEEICPKLNHGRVADLK